MANENRLIDANNARVVAQRIYSDPVLIHAILNTLDNTPTVDAAPVVRCKDCEKWHTPDCIMSDGLMEAEDNDFCSYGERRAET